MVEHYHLSPTIDQLTSVVIELGWVIRVASFQAAADELKQYKKLAEIIESMEF